jgi:hypothetical protein
MRSYQNDNNMNLHVFIFNSNGIKSFLFFFQYLNPSAPIPFL